MKQNFKVGEVVRLGDKKHDGYYVLECKGLDYFVLTPIKVDEDRPALRVTPELQDRMKAY